MRFWLGLLFFLVLSAHAEGYYRKKACSSDSNKRFTRLVTFGHSCTDDAGDGSGFTRYSNGNVWAEYVAERMDVILDNKAWGGANSDYTNTNTGPLEQTGFLWQVDSYIPTDVFRTVHTVWVGYNDFWDGNGDPIKAAQNVVLGLTRLLEKGAKYLIVFTEGKYEEAPGYSTSFNNADFCHAYDYSSVKEIVGSKLVEFNAALKQFILASTPLSGTDVHLFIFDTWSLYRDVLVNKVFSNTDSAWIDYRFQYPFKSSQFMWWDGWHATTEMHKLISDSLFEVVPFFNDRQYDSSHSAQSSSYDVLSAMNKIVAFGHSLSGDTGSGINFTRSTNGPLWIEYLSMKMDVPVLSMSWSGSKTDSSNIYSSISLGFLSQIQLYQPVDISKTLHTISIGIFDFYNGLGDKSVAVQNIFSGIQNLVNRGAKNFLLFNEIKWDEAPVFKGFSAGCHLPDYTLSRETVSASIAQFNSLLYSKYVSFQTENPSVNIMFFDAWSVHEKTFSRSTFSDTTTPWYGCRYSHPYDVSNFMWWDSWNPTTTLHKIFADAVLGQFYSKLFSLN